MGRKGRYRKVPDSVLNFGEPTYSGKRDDPVHQKANSKMTSIDGFILENESKRNVRKLKLVQEGLRPRQKRKSVVRPTEPSKKRKGESNRDYFVRLNKEANAKAVMIVKKGTKSSMKKKEFFRMRKEKKKKRKKGTRNNTEDEWNFGRSHSKIETRRVGVHNVAVKPPEFEFSKKRFKEISSFKRILH